MTAQDADLVAFTDPDYNSLRSSINSPNSATTIEVNLFLLDILLFTCIFQNKQDSARAFLRDYNPGDIRCVNLFATNADVWQISRPIRDLVVSELRSNATVPVRFSYTIIRNPPNEDDAEDITAVVTGENTFEITSGFQQIRQELIDVLNETSDSETKTQGFFLF